LIIQARAHKQAKQRRQFSRYVFIWAGRAVPLLVGAQVAEWLTYCGDKAQIISHNSKKNGLVKRGC